MSELAPELRERAAAIRVVLLDVDGVLTDGRLIMGSDGYEARAFHVRDGAGIRLGQRGGLTFGIISGRDSKVVEHRAAELDISEVHQGIYDKEACFDEMLRRLSLDAQTVCFVGDDLVDVPVMRRVGFAVAPSDGAEEARDAAHHVTQCEGGRGVVREVVDLLLRASGKWDRIRERYLR